VTSPARRALGLLVEPVERDAPRAPSRPLDVAVTGLSERCGTSTIAQGLRCELPAARVTDGFPFPAADVLVVVAGNSALPVLARLVVDRLRQSHPAAVLVANRPGDPEEWKRAGALCVPQSRLGVMLLARGRRAFGPLGAALREIATAATESCR
jgi:hypothetical protein